ncbi:DJ-1/PfpI family protein [Brucepastera parasyntrophica]|uniref:DJ-1 family glyoxalase III n=1 Tax=Brucepastera parasyntrophica TaxID=2880008 RepID=UPI00210A5FE8|nr:DJ-1 family glyoxalase III [Brucepastera parasyntrophica]ULQ59281.1 DJ-1/PfpI family protein [Brucepastera parasyntrophica]
MKKAVVFLAEGFEEVEAVTPIDYLRRAGAQVTLAGVSGRTVMGSHEIEIVCDLTIEEYLKAAGSSLPDLAVLPGGGRGSENLAASKELRDFVSRMMLERKGVGAICAAPAVALGSWGLLAGKTWTGFPGSGDALGLVPREDRVITDSNLITARAAGCAEEFALALIAYLFDMEKSAEIAYRIFAR